MAKDWIEECIIGAKDLMIAFKIYNEGIAQWEAMKEKDKEIYKDKEEFIEIKFRMYFLTREIEALVPITEGA